MKRIKDPIKNAREAAAYKQIQFLLGKLQHVITVNTKVKTHPEVVSIMEAQLERERVACEANFHDLLEGDDG